MAVAVLAGLPVGADATSSRRAPLVLSDARGDAVPGLRGDITKVVVTTSGATSRGRYVPQALVVQLQVADAVDRSGGTYYAVNMSLPGCSDGVYLEINPGQESNRRATCEYPGGIGHYVTNTDPIVAANTITWNWPFKYSPSRSLMPGARVGWVHAYSTQTLPVLKVTPFAHSGERQGVFNDDVRGSGAGYSLG